MKYIMRLVALINLIMGGFLLYDAVIRLTTNQQLLIFDEYLGGFARALPVLLAISMLLAALLILIRTSSAMVFYSYINSFLFLLFYTPSVFYSGIKERYSPAVIVIQFLVLITCTILLFMTRGKGVDSVAAVPKKRLDDHKRSMQRYLDPEEDGETTDSPERQGPLKPGNGK